MSLVLVVDDSRSIRNIIGRDLKKDGYDVIYGENGLEGWDLILEHGNDIDVILLDRVMPAMDGMELLKKIKADDRFSAIPVIMETSASAQDQIVEGLQAGVYYYLTKPFTHDVLVPLVNAAEQEYSTQKKYLQEIEKNKRMLAYVYNCDIYFKTVEEAQELALLLANFYPDPKHVVVGILEILLNAVEHGNLGISYDEKSEFNMKQIYTQEVKRRQELPENKNKFVTVTFKRSESYILLAIKDQGDGFNWEQYMEIDVKRATDNHGRGIAMSNSVYFDEVKYLGKGNEVFCIVNLSTYQDPKESASH